MNVNLHSADSFHSLGMIRIKGSMPSEKAAELVEERLNYFQLSMENDIVSSITDGASVMKKFGRITSPHNMPRSCDSLERMRHSVQAGEL